MNGQCWKRQARLFLSFILMFSLPLAFSSCASHKAYYFGNYSEAESLYNHGEYERAIQKYQAYIDENPEGHLALISLYYIGRSHAALGHKDAAKEIFQKIIREHPNVIWANFAETQIKELDQTAPAKS